MADRARDRQVGKNYGTTFRAPRGYENLRQHQFASSSSDEEQKEQEEHRYPYHEIEREEQKEEEEEEEEEEEGERYTTHSGKSDCVPGQRANQKTPSLRSHSSDGSRRYRRQNDRNASMDPQEHKTDNEYISISKRKIQYVSVGLVIVIFVSAVTVTGIYLGKCLKPGHCDEWSEWSACSVTCYEGIQHRTRRCYGNGSEYWERNYTDSMKCVKQACLGFCEDWTPWTPCSVTCNEGRQLRTQTCYGNSSQYWKTNFTESIRCVEDACIAHCDAWTEWGPCSVTCNEGRQLRTRACYGNSSQHWAINFTDSVKCVEDTCLGTWLEWGPWGMCSTTCGDGIRSRERNCSDKYCGLDNKNYTSCTNEPCLGTWSDWGLWGTCSASCDCGVMSRERTCSKSYCGLDNKDYSICSQDMCSGTWSDWGSWDTCSASCGCGVMSRERSCPVRYCGLNDKDKRECNIEDCTNMSNRPECWTYTIFFFVLVVTHIFAVGFS